MNGISCHIIAADLNSLHKILGSSEASVQMEDIKETITTSLPVIKKSILVNSDHKVVTYFKEANWCQIEEHFPGHC